MPAFTPDDVERIAELARLALTDDERALFARQLADILAYAEQMQQVDTSGVAADVACVRRTDIAARR